MMEYIVEKIGMSRTTTVPSVPVTLVKVLDAKVCEVDDKKTAIVAYSNGKKNDKTIEGQQKKYNLTKEYNRFITLTVANAQAGDLDVAPLGQSTLVKSTFNTKGRGFAGAIKRHGFSGGPGAHGSRFHRRVGSIGNAEWPGRVQRGKKMPGHYGNVQVTVKNDIVSFDTDTGVLALKGAIPGANGALGKIRIVK